MSHLTGRATITAGGRRLPSKEGAKLGLGNVKRSAEMGDAGVLGYKEAPTVPYVECTVEHSRDMSVQEFANMVDVTVSFDTDSGRSFVLRNAWQANELVMDKGQISLRFEAISCEEI